MKTDNKLRIDILLFIFLCLLAIALLDQTVKCINFLLLNNALNENICFISAFLIFTVIIICLFKFDTISIYKQCFNKLDLLFLGVFLFYYLMKLPFPDVAYDTVAYEIFMGKFAFQNNPLNMKPFVQFYSGWFSLANRVFYYFRLVFGYRLSTIINFYVICVSYYKVKELLFFFLNYMDEKKFKNMNRYFSAIFICGAAFAALYKEYLILGSTISKGDLFVIPLFFECVLLLFKMKNTGKSYAYVGLLIGLSVTLKLTNAVFFIPLIICYFIKEFSGIKTKNILIAICFCVIPLLPYIIHNFVLTGNPVFPFYNKIFKSPYYPFINFKDTRWGPKTTVEIIYWPIVIFFNRERISELEFYSGSLAIGYLLMFLVFSLRKDIPALKKVSSIYACLFCSILLWSATTGYGRYMIPLEVLSIILLAVFIYAIYCNCVNRAKFFVFGCYLLVTIIPLHICTNNLVLSFYEWSWRPSVFTDKSYYMDQVKPNLKYIFNDRTATDNPAIRSKLDSAKTWVCIGPDTNTAYPTLSNPSADFFFLLNNYYAAMDRKEFTKNYFESRPKDGIYVLTNWMLNKEAFDFLSSFGFVIVGYERFNLDFANANATALFLTLALKDQAETQGIKELALEDIK